MKKIKIALLSLFVCALGYVSYSTYDYMTMTDAERFLLQNIEALTIEEPGGGGGLDANYERIEGYCTVSASLEGKVKALGLTVVKITGEGKIEISGKVVCRSGGTETCRPVECIEIYEKLNK